MPLVVGVVVGIAGIEYHWDYPLLIKVSIGGTSLTSSTIFANGSPYGVAYTRLVL